jgi:hypothetical protein
VSGRWEEHGLAWHETSVSHCEVCGCLLPRRAWVFQDGPRMVRACGEPCEELYHSYVKPTSASSGGPDAA